ncbi:hypothetical protein PIB30_065537 [Stylosanthes scabra]|uniref:Uncharacterized protein n=1 Tax=Stylosanthes scabra TaxID=79078 RepID=A0ABU6SM13_9FABA|nr:hypothetical protein [Stylosanthes scabra]
MAHISDIKLIRTDTTLDLSQKAEKVAMGSKPSAWPLPATAYHQSLRCHQQQGWKASLRPSLFATCKAQPIYISATMQITSMPSFMYISSFSSSDGIVLIMESHNSPKFNPSRIDTNLIGEEYDDESLLLLSMDLTTHLWLKSELTKMILHPYTTTLCDRLIMGFTCPCVGDGRTSTVGVLIMMIKFQ